jgi:hypothetical protein
MRTHESRWKQIPFPTGTKKKKERKNMVTYGAQQQRKMNSQYCLSFASNQIPTQQPPPFVLILGYLISVK